MMVACHKHDLQAARAFGMTRGQQFRSVVWPHLIRLAWPAYTNEVVGNHEKQSWNGELLSHRCVSGAPIFQYCMEYQKRMRVVYHDHPLFTFGHYLEVHSSSMVGMRLIERQLEDLAKVELDEAEQRRLRHRGRQLMAR